MLSLVLYQAIYQSIYRCLAPRRNVISDQKGYKLQPEYLPMVNAFTGLPDDTPIR